MTDQFNIKEAFGKSIEADKNKKRDIKENEKSQSIKRKMLMDKTNDLSVKKVRRIKLGDKQN